MLASFYQQEIKLIIHQAGTNGNSGEIIREQEYAGFLYPDVLRSTPLATTIGNHESMVDDYINYYNNPT